LTVNVGPVVAIWIVLPLAKSDMLVGAFSVIDVPDVNPAIVSERSDGIVSECVDVTVQGAGLAAFEVMEQLCAPPVRAATAIAAAARPARAAILQFMITPVNG
jgi:hypothetical protein